MPSESSPTTRLISHNKKSMILEFNELKNRVAQ
jgi:hypothetical protein